MILFKKVRWKNFLSTGNNFTDIDLTKHKSTLIVGTNGSGKSTILDAISFALYNKPFRKINKPQLINSINGKDLCVELEFIIGNANYKIVRGIKPTKFEIYKNDVLLNQDADSKDYQEVVEKQIVKMNHRTFSQVVVLGSSTYVPFMQLPAAQRREVIEDLLDIQVFTTMNTLLKGKVSANQDDLKQAKYDSDLIDEKINIQNSYINSLKKDVQNKVDENVEKIQQTQDEINVCNVDVTTKSGTIAEKMKETANLEKLQKRMEKSVILKEKTIDKLSKLNKEIKFFHDNDDCPTCKQGIPHEFKAESITTKQTQVTEIQENLTLLEEDYNNTVTEITRINGIQKEIQTIQHDITKLQSEIQSKKKFIDYLQSENDSLQSDTANVDAEKQKLKELQKQKTEAEDKKQKLLEEYEILQAASALLKDGGIKTRILRQYMPIINKLINKYLAAMDFFVQFEIDEQFNETIKSRFRDEFSYNSFSEGEKMRINLAVLFTWRAIAKMRNSAATNLLVMDEVFDSSLDSNGTDEFLKIIQTLTADTNTFIISHKTDQLFDKFHNVIRFEKTKNFSRIV
jgi:DNA repair exonuclease SbcCD ATPase subunit